jgi:transposase
MQNQLFEAALGIARPWYVRGIDFDAARKVLTIGIDFVAGSRFAAPGVEGVHPVHDTQTKRLRHLNFFQHECYLEVRTPRIKLPDGRVVQIEPDWFGKLSGFTLLFEALVLALAQQMPFAAVARLVSESWHRVHAICSRYAISPWPKPTSPR